MKTSAIVTKEKSIPFRLFFVVVCACWLACSCAPDKGKRLPIFGERELVHGDTVFHVVGEFQLLDQDSNLVTEKTVHGKIYVADFFFTSCRTICPIMKTQMLRVYQEIKDDPEVLLVSHTIDPKHDTVALLRDFAERLGVESNKWHFLTGNQDSIYSLAQRSYFVTTMEDQAEPDGFIHSGAFLLVDKERRIRGKYDGTAEDDVNRLLSDIENLKKEYDVAHNAGK